MTTKLQWYSYLSIFVWFTIRARIKCQLDFFNKIDQEHNKKNYGRLLSINQIWYSSNLNAKKSNNNEKTQKKIRFLERMLNWTFLIEWCFRLWVLSWLWATQFFLSLSSALYSYLVTHLGILSQLINFIITS